MYIETSSPRRQGDNAKIEKGGLSFSGNTCIRFFYHMYGASTGTLNVFVGGKKIFTKAGNQGNSWKEENVKVSDVGVFPVSSHCFLFYFIYVFPKSTECPPST